MTLLTCPLQPDYKLNIQVITDTLRPGMLFAVLRLKDSHSILSVLDYITNNTLNILPFIQYTRTKLHQN